MEHVQYKFERFAQPQFPIYVSVQTGRKELVKIHYHASAEILMIQEGCVLLLIGNLYRECRKGDIIFIPPSVVHGAVSLTDDAATLGITYELSLIDIPGLELNLSELFHRTQHSQYIVSPLAEGHLALCKSMRSITEIYGDFSVCTKMQLISHLLQITASLVRIFSLEQSVQDKKYLKLRPVLAHIDEHYMDKIQISQLSDIIHVCDDRLIRLFKEVTGETPIEYVMNLRIEQGIKLLTSTDLPITEVAERTGFGSDTYMTRIFKKKLNTTPGKYRR